MVQKLSRGFQEAGAPKFLIMQTIQHRAEAGVSLINFTGQTSKTGTMVVMQRGEEIQMSEQLILTECMPDCPLPGK